MFVLSSSSYYIIIKSFKVVVFLIWQISLLKIHQKVQTITYQEGWEEYFKGDIIAQESREEYCGGYGPVLINISEEQLSSIYKII